jgi:DNA (cytosine-5)-methyltransferase 3A
MRVLSLFDGMACGMLAFMEAGVEVERYDAYEIDKYAIQTATHNFPNIKEHGDVFTADFTEYKGVDFVIGGSPCTYWSIAQKNNRETEASGMGWELFQQYVRAIKEAEPKYFIYENNASMSKAIRESIDNAFGFAAVEINSALVSAQQRRRLYWVGKRNADGTYSKVKVEQPKDRGILLKDVLCGMTDRDKARAVLSSVGRTTHREYFQKHQNTIALEPVAKEMIPPCGQRGQDKSRTITAGYHICSERDLRMDIETNGYMGKQGVVEVVGAIPENETVDGKSQCVRATCYKDTIRNLVGNDYDRRTCVAEPIRVGSTPNPNEGGAKTGLYAIPVNETEKYLSEKMIGYVYKEGTKNFKCSVKILENKSCPLTTKQDKRAGTTNYVPQNINTINCEITTDGTIKGAKPIYEVKDGFITINGKQYPIKLADGYYIIRKLTVRECARLQTVPEWYEFPVSDTQAYKCLGNGWTISVISHLIEAALSNKVVATESKQLSIFDLL